jgi:cytochrome c oxidase cbb3-type subunit 3
MMTASKSLTIICRHGGCICFMHQLFFGIVYMVRYEVLGADNRRWNLKEVAQAKIDIAEYMKTAPDMMDEKQ